MACALLGPPANVMGNCPCNGDVDNNGITDPNDQFCVQNCAQFGQCLCCVNSCDVNCDGNVTPADAGAIQCLMDGNPPNICCPKGGEPCCYPQGFCQSVPAGQCAADGGTVVSHCPPDNRCVPPAEDCFTTQCGRTLFDFCNDPIPADFFAPGSEPFSGVIQLGGPLDGFPDTVVQRRDAMLLDGPPETIPIELVKLNLSSCSPIPVNPGPTFWDVTVTLAGNPVPPGSMTVTKQHPNGGTFTATFNVLPRFVFTEVDNPTNQKVLDFGLEGRPPTLFETTDTPKWVHNSTVPMPFLCGTNFVPGIEEDPGTLEQCCTETCHANPGGGHDHCTKTCNVCPRGACCTGGGACIVIDPNMELCPGEYKGDGTNCDDSDGDGLADWFENNDCCQSSTACNSASSPNNPDTDGDGINDGTELAAGCDPCIPNDCIPPGDDCFATSCGNTTYDFCETPIPADFFDPGSRPFEDVVLLQGADGPPNADTVMRRLSPLSLPNIGDSTTVPIELVSLSLVGCDPITINNIGGPDSLWAVSVTLSPTPAPQGSMTVRKTHPNGGVFYSEFLVQPLFIFRRTTPPFDVRMLDTGAEGIPPAMLGAVGSSPWVRTPSVPVQPLCDSYFAPGVEGDPANLMQCQSAQECCVPVGHAGPGHLHVTGEACGPCPCGACCKPDASCEIVEGADPQGECNVLGGTYGGDGTTCDDSDADGIPDWFEKSDCCQPTTPCFASSDPHDANTDDDPFGLRDGTEVSLGCDPCNPNDCFEACCLPNASCQHVAPGTCAGTVVSHCPPDNRCVPPGDDCFNTQCGRTLFDFCDDPIPADFFAPGSEPFSGIIILGGPNDGLPDTVVRRFDPLLLDGPPETIDIELVELKLVSCDPIVVHNNQVILDTFWDVSVVLSADPVPQGNMTVAKTDPNGGTFDAQFYVLPRFVFTEVGNPGNQRVLDFGVEGLPPTLFDATGTPKWVHNATVPIPNLCGVNFVPGVEENPQTLEQCCTETCHANPGGGHDHCTKTCNVCPAGACCQAGACTVVDGGGNCPGEYKGDGTNCDDSDSDGIPDWFENNDCCQPSTACSVASNPNDADTDDDGVRDGDEMAYGCDPCAPNDCIPPGDDCFATSCGDTAFDFCNDPIPADFFHPGSQPFDGLVLLQGANGPPIPDTFMRRTAPLFVPNPGDSMTVPIELVSLNLVSCQPIIVAGGDTLWNVEVTLSPTPAPLGSMTVRKTHPNGGVFTSDFLVQPLFTFTNTENPGDVRVFDTGAEGIPPAMLQAVGSSPWVMTPSVAVQPLCGQNFAPGVEGDPANLLQCQSATQCCVPVGHAGPGHLHVTGESCTPCPCGACCKIDATCEVLEGVDPEGQCNALGGTYGGDGSTCDDSDADGIPDWFEKSDCCQPTTPCFSSSDPHNPDTDGDGVNDGDEIAQGTDPCVAEGGTPPTPTWDCSGGLGQASCVARTRGLTFRMVPPVVATGGGTSAIRITMMDLQNPVPANDPCCPPPNFANYESATCNAVGEAGGCARWVGAPFTYLEAQELPGFGNYRASRLQCSPYYDDWENEPGQLVNVIGAEILPSSTYAVRSYGSSCKGTEGTCSNVSADVTMQTRRAGDIAAAYQDPAAPRTQPNAIDIVGAVNNFKKAVGAPKHIEAQVQPNLPNLNRDVDALDIQAVVTYQKLGAYPYAGPCRCPSMVTCNATMCSGTNPCPGGQCEGSGAPCNSSEDCAGRCFRNTCVQTCSAGPRTGEPCTLNKHCGMCVGGTRPGIPCDADGQCDGGTCTTGTCNTQGFCRDHCGRCN